jgi:hypothetical protein
VGNAEVNQARLLDTGDDFDAVPERILGLVQKAILGLGEAQGIGADSTHTFGMQSAYALTESFQAVERTFCNLEFQSMAVCEPGGQAYRLAQAVDELELTVLQPANNHVKAV